MVRRDRGAWWKKAVFVSLFATTLPYAWLLFVAGPGVVGVIPIVWALGFAISAVFREWAWPDPICSACGALLTWAPRASEAYRRAPLSSRPSVAA